MISHEEFAKLRLVQFRPDDEIAQLEDWEFMDHIWVGEAIRFSEWLRLESDSDSLRSLAIDFDEFPANTAEQVLSAIELPLRRGLNLEQIQSVVGEPVHEEHFVADRASYDFVLDGPSRYFVSCIILNVGGLIYLVVMTPLPDPDEDE
ncbi:MAG: hypothetical protein WD768_05475 [Phycisphaeraceae bacterium]